MAATGGRLGAIDARLAAPLHAAWQASFAWVWLLAAASVLGVYLVHCRRLFLDPAVSVRRLLSLSFAYFVAIGLSVSMIDGDFRERTSQQLLPAFLEPYTRTHNEYFGDVPKVERLGVRGFLQKYPQPAFFSKLSAHARTHPPGGVLFLWCVSRLFGYNLGAAALASIAFAGLTIPLVYALGRDLYGEAAGRIGVALFLVTPNFVMFTTTSMDGPFSVFPLLAVYLFLRSLRAGRAWGTALLTGVALALATLMTYASVFIATYFACVAVLTALTARAALRRMAAVLGAALVAFIGFHLLVMAATGFDPIAAVRASLDHDAGQMGTGHESVSQYLNLSVANLMAFLLGAGVALTTVWIRQLVQALREALHGKPVDTFVVGYAVALAAMACSTLFTMEVERVWMFTVPFVVIAAAKHLQGLREAQKSASSFYWVAALLCLQVVLFEARLATSW